MYSKLFKIFILVVWILGNIGVQSASALEAGDSLPAENNSAMVKVGQTAPNLVLPVVDEQEGNLDFKVGIPTIIISVHSGEYIEKLQEVQKLYVEYKDKIRFYVIMSGDKEEIAKSFKKNNLTIPVIIDSTIHFIRKYNNGVPAMMITDGEGKVTYNGSFFINMNSLKRYIDKLIAGEKELPNLSYTPPIKRNFTPNTMKLGTVINKETFKDLDDNDVEIVYSDKPTVLLFWLNFSSPENLEKYMSVMEASYKQNQEKANYYTVVNQTKKEFVLKTLEKHHSTIPALAGSGLKYSLSFPSIVIVDAQGVFRYRSVPANTEELQRLLNECQTSYKAPPEPKNADEWAKRGETFLANSNYLEAIDAYDHCLSLEPKFYLAYVKRGYANYKLHRDKNSYNDYSKAIELNPKEISNYYSRAEVAKNLRKFPEMVADYSQIIAINPKESQAYLYRGNHYMQNMQPSLAISDYTKVIEYLPKGVEGYLKRGYCYLTMKKYEEALNDYNQAVVLNPREAKGYYGRGVVYFMQQQYGQAITEFNRAIALNPERDYYASRGITYLRQGKSDLAILDYTKLIELTSNDGYAYLWRGNIYVLRNEYQEALKDFYSASKLNPRNGEIAFALAQCLEINQEQDKALENYKIALEYLPQFKKTLLTKAQHRVDGDWESYKEWID